ncbi:molybdopterin synthase sulfur carrier subunit [Chloropicon roscoffensis]|uniref:Molybdopterin synthase sulfur carrier subunit n=1 Tax=Chloropicon roscoffensis TaxID=1461544 RepID=A0AAX4PBD3_9CHLO
MGEVRLRVLYFAAAREAAGVESEEVSLEEEGTDDRGTPYATTEALEELLLGRYPKLKDIFRTVVLAVNMDYVDKGARVKLAPGDEVALIPPIGGG